MPDFKRQLELYAELVIKVGVNLQPGQTLFIGAGREQASARPETAEFVRSLAQQAYAAGAPDVQIHWSDPALTRLRLERSPLTVLSDYPAWKVDWFMQAVAQNAALVFLACPDPQAAAGLPREKINAALKAEASALRPFRQATSNMQVSWCGVAVPTRAWAGPLFPELPEEQAVAALWELVFRTVLVDTGDPVQAWQQHLQELGIRQHYLNSLRLQQLRFQGPGTDLTLALPAGHRWESIAGATNASGLPIAPNLPSEEIFTAPRREGVNGVVRSTLPVIFQGTRIEGIELQFDRGRITRLAASQGFEALLSLIETDEGTRYLGEVALVPVDSPIARMGIVFNNVLLDENASCHIAIGSAYGACLEGGTAMTPEELLQHGINQSIMHMDFMIGSESLDIDGITQSGQTVPIFRQGKWAAIE